MTVRTRPDAVDWTSVVAEHMPRLRRVVARRVPADLIDDVVQETFLRAYRSRASHDADRPIGPWLNTIAIRVAADLSRCSPTTPAAVPALALSVAGPDVELTTIERVALIRRALAALSPRHRQLLESVALDGISQVALAQREGVAPEVIRSTVLRARQRFRVVYERLAQEHGLVGLGGSIKPVLATLRTRSVSLEPSMPRKLEAAAVLVSLLTVGPSLVQGASALRTTTPSDLATIDGALTNTRAEHVTPADAKPPVNVAVSRKVPGGDIRGNTSYRGPLDVNGFWELSMEPVGLVVVAGTTDSAARLSVELTTHDVALGATATFVAEGECAPPPNRTTYCTALELAERVLRAPQTLP